MRRPPRRVQNGLTTLHRVGLRLSGWRLGATISGLPVLLLTTRGRRSGKPQTVPLMYVDDDGYIVIGSNGGAPSHPGWVLNLRARPEAEIETAAGRVAVRAEEIADADERARLWARITATAPTYDVYALRTERAIPLLRLRPAAGMSPPAPK